ncbi:GNAT family N-acetyltransferase [Ensifer sp. ENS12]|uniref:GNAT family N-acetyltransferase n=1 Tax=Ensifer sp. ENS12 TaxID=2854774 RepID=UPI000DE467E6|nr:N-acetyltransferase [Ensifer sp. ENS12]MBV7518848.1 N-acetyltransferase [Ensifer sp. ENS12]
MRHDSRPAKGVVSAQFQVNDNQAQQRFELLIADGPLAVAYYRIENGAIVLVPTEVPYEFSGAGFATKLDGVFALVRQRGARVVPKC